MFLLLIRLVCKIKSLFLIDFSLQAESWIRNHLRNEISKPNAMLNLSDLMPNLTCLAQIEELITL